MATKRKFKIDLGEARIKQIENSPIYDRPVCHLVTKEIGCRQFDIKVYKHIGCDNEMPINIGCAISSTDTGEWAHDLPGGDPTHWARLGVLCLQVATHIDDDGADEEYKAAVRAAKAMLKAIPKCRLKQLTKDDGSES